MYATSVFYYTQRQIVVLLTGFSPRKYMPQYAKPLTLHKGVDNQIQFQFLNQEQKPVDITGKTITCRVISYDGTKVLVTKALTPQLPLTGIAALYLNAADLENIDVQKAYYSLEIPVNGFDFPVFVDQNAGARGDMNIVNSVLPSFIPSADISIPTGQPFPNLAAGPNTSPWGTSNANTYSTSVIETNDNPVLTIQINYNQFNGNVEVQGSTEVDSDWYTIQTHSYTNTSETVGYVLKGYHPYVRVNFTSTSGQVDKVLSR